MLGGGAVERDPLLGLVEQEADLPGLEPGDADEMAMREGVDALGHGIFGGRLGHDRRS